MHFLTCFLESRTIGITHQSSNHCCRPQCHDIRAFGRCWWRWNRLVRHIFVCSCLTMGVPNATLFIFQNLLPILLSFLPFLDSMPGSSWIIKKDKVCHRPLFVIYKRALMKQPEIPTHYSFLVEVKPGHWLGHSQKERVTFALRMPWKCGPGEEPFELGQSRKNMPRTALKICEYIDWPYVLTFAVNSQFLGHDSMFSICRFREVTGHYPTKITIVSFTFKENRFTRLHATALGWPQSKLSYIGIDPPASTGFNLQQATEGEWKNAAAPFDSDPYGCHSEVLQEKRKQRNPFSRTSPYPLTCPEMKDLLRYCGPELFPKSRLPWA